MKADDVSQDGEKAQLLQELQSLKSLLDHCPHGVTANDLSGLITYSSPVHAAMLGYVPEELEFKKHIWDMHYPGTDGQKRELKEYLAYLIAEQPAPTPYLTQNRTKDGRVVYTQVDWDYQRDEHGQLIGFVSALTDITRRVEIEERASLHMRAVSSRISGMLQAIPDYVYIIDSDGMVLQLNQLGHDWPEDGDLDEMITPQTIAETFPTLDPGAVLEVVRETISRQETRSLEYGLHQSDGTRWFEGRTAQLKAEGDRQSVVWIARDVTEFKRVQRQLYKTQKMEAIGVLVGGIAHELNNLLAPIIGYAEMILARKTKSDPDSKGLMQIDKAARKAGDLVKRMLAYGRRSISQRTPLNMVNLVGDVVDLLRGSLPENVSISVHTESDDIFIVGVPDEIHQVMLNLCINAIHAMPSGGSLTVHIGYHKGQPPRDGSRETARDERVQVKVEDTGFGIQSDILERIFDPFFTTKAVGEGSGLGLSVVQGIIEQHRGHIDVESVVGRGTTFFVYLPAHEEPLKTYVDNRTEESISHVGQRILLVDDEEIVLDLTKAVLVEIGCHVTQFSGPSDALRWFTEHCDEVDAVLTDYGMPGMSGKGMLTEIKAIRDDVPIILMTGYGDLVSKERVELWGVSAFLTKPFDRSQLSGALAKAWNRID